MSRGLILLILPGLGVLTGPMIGKNVFGIIEGGGTWDWEYQVSATAQLCAAGLCFLAAVRKYRRDDQVAFTPLLGMVLLAGWVFLCVLGIKYWNIFQTRTFGRMPPELEIRVVGSIVSSLLLALVPVSSAAWLEREWERRHRLADVSLHKRAVSPLAVVLLAVLIILALPVVGQNLDRIDFRHAHLLETSLSAAFFLLSSLYLLRILYRVTTRVLIPMLALIVVTWAFPYLIDIARYAAVGDLNTEILTWISTCSPIGMLAAIWNDRNVVLWPGLIVLLFGSYAELVPLAVIGGMLVVIGIELIAARVPSARLVFRTGEWGPIAAMVITLLSALFIPLQDTIFLGAGLSLILYVVASSRKFRLQQAVRQADGS
jgi:hypothetical protein